MFVLRRTMNDGTERNFNLGDSYTLIDKDSSRDAFEIHMKCEQFNPDKGEIYAFVTGDNKYKGLPLYKGQKSYIMTSRGDTFANVSHC